MTKKDFWRNSTIAVMGGGSFGTVLANVLSQNCREVRFWVRNNERAREINSTRINAHYLPAYRLEEKVHALSEVERVFEGGLQAVVWALPSRVCRQEAKAMAGFFKGDEITLHATKGIEQGSLKRISEVLGEELPCPRIGVISGPNLALEIARGEPAATVVASFFDEVVEAGRELLAGADFRTYSSNDMIGVEWAGTLKNILAIASGALDALSLGWNVRSMLITLGLSEMVRFGVTLGAKESTFLGLAGLGDLLATCSSPLSRNYQVGYRIAKGEKLSTILKELGSTAEGVETTRSVYKFALEHSIGMPIVAGVFRLLEEKVSAKEILLNLMAR